MEPSQSVRKRPGNLISFTKKKDSSPGPKGKVSTGPMSPTKTENKSSYNLKNSKSIVTKIPIHEPSIKSGSFSQIGMSPDNPKKVNQDSCFVIENFLGMNNCHLFGVCDGHGQYGLEISSFIKDRLPFLLSNNRSLIENPRQVLLNTVSDLQSEILRKKFDSSFSGSTLNLILLIDHKLYCANVGDSRAVLARRDPRRWTDIVISRDHKPEIPEEKKRIESNGGRVEAYKDEDGQPYGPTRVWVKNQDFPGIAMSRSLGDSVANSIGVISVPEITERDLATSDKFIIMGSDGLFEFITNEDMVRLAATQYKSQDPGHIAQHLVRIAHERWRKEEESVDDITCICILLKIESNL